jgi:hypothetical protein
MINDYAGYCATVGESKMHHLAGRATARNSLTIPASGLFKKAASVVVALSLLLGLSSTLWYSMRINEALDTIGQNKATLQKLTLEETALANQRNRLQTPDAVRHAAAKLGLFPPGDRQIRTP